MAFNSRPRWVTETFFPFAAPYSMRGNTKITAETWGKLFAVLPESKVSNLKFVPTCSSRILECPLSWGRGGVAKRSTQTQATSVSTAVLGSVDDCDLGPSEETSLAGALEANVTLTTLRYS